MTMHRPYTGSPVGGTEWQEGSMGSVHGLKKVYCLAEIFTPEQAVWFVVPDCEKVPFFDEPKGGTPLNNPLIDFYALLSKSRLHF